MFIQDRSRKLFPYPLTDSICFFTIGDSHLPYPTFASFSKAMLKAEDSGRGTFSLAQQSSLHSPCLTCTVLKREISISSCASPECLICFKNLSSLAATSAWVDLGVRGQLCQQRLGSLRTGVVTPRSYAYQELIAPICCINAQALSSTSLGRSIEDVPFSSRAD